MFRELSLVNRAVDLIGRDVQHSLDSMPFGSIEQGEHAIHISLNKGAGFQNRAVIVAFGGEIDDIVNLLRFDNAVDDGFILNFAGIKRKARRRFRVALHIRNRGEISGVGEGVECHHAIIGAIFKNVAAIVRADKARAARD